MGKANVGRRDAKPNQAVQIRAHDYFCVFLVNKSTEFQNTDTQLAKSQFWRFTLRDRSDRAILLNKQYEELQLCFCQLMEGGEAG